MQVSEIGACALLRDAIVVCAHGQEDRHEEAGEEGTGRGGRPASAADAEPELEEDDRDAGEVDWKDDEEEPDVDDDEEQSDDEARHRAMLAAIRGAGEAPDARKRRRAAAEMVSEAFPESEYNLGGERA